jgi:hypothetical protein
MTDCEEITHREADAWHVVSMRHLNDAQMGALLEWLDNMEGGRFYWTLSKNFWFEREEDRTLCVLTWG